MFPTAYEAKARATLAFQEKHPSVLEEVKELILKASKDGHYRTEYSFEYETEEDENRGTYPTLIQDLMGYLRFKEYKVLPAHTKIHIMWSANGN